MPSSKARRRPACASESVSFLDVLHPELLEMVCDWLHLKDITALASVTTATSSLHSMRIQWRVEALRMLTQAAQGHLIGLVVRLPVECPTRQQVLFSLENAMAAFQRVCMCSETFLLLSRAVALRGVIAPSSMPVEAARLARCCCNTCDGVSTALISVGVRLHELVRLAARSTAHRNLLAALLQPHQAQPPALDGSDAEDTSEDTFDANEEGEEGAWEGEDATWDGEDSAWEGEDGDEGELGISLDGRIGEDCEDDGQAVAQGEVGRRGCHVGW